MILERDMNLPEQDLKSMETSHLDLVGQPNKPLHSDLELLQLA